MDSYITLIIILAVWILLNRVIFPKMGIPT